MDDHTLRYFFDDDIEDVCKKIDDPYVGLWVCVLLLCVIDIFNGEDKSLKALAWVKDRSNVFFNVAAEALNYRPGFLRRKILKMAEDRVRGSKINRYGHISISLDNLEENGSAICDIQGL